MKQLKDYLHLYLGCEVQHFEGEIYRLLGVDQNLDEVFIKGNGSKNQWWDITGNVQLILRPLSDMTEEEDNMLEDLEMRNHRNTGFATAFLLSKHFDLFELIEAGLAIDKTTVNATTS